VRACATQPADHLSARPHGRAVQIAPARACSISGFRRTCTTAPPSRGRPRTAAPLCPDEQVAATSTTGWSGSRVLEYLSFIKDEQGACRGIAALDLRTMDIRRSPRRGVPGDGRPRIVYVAAATAPSTRQRQTAAPTWTAPSTRTRKFVQVHRPRSPGEDKHAESESAARRAADLGPKRRGTRATQEIPENERWSS